MNTAVGGAEVTVVRIYLTEKGADLDALLQRLHDREQVQGVTVFRGIAGYGESGEVHTARRVALSLDLPLVVEFFDVPERISRVLADLAADFKPRHILSWTARVNTL